MSIFYLIFYIIWCFALWAIMLYMLLHNDKSSKIERILLWLAYMILCYLLVWLSVELFMMVIKKINLPLPIIIILLI